MMRAFLKLTTAVLAIAGLFVALGGDAFSSHEKGGQLLPNLKTLDPANFSVSTSGGGNGNRPSWAGGGGGGDSEQRLLFDNEVMNLHTAPLELVPTGVQCTTGKGAEGRIALQRVYRDANGDGDGGFTRGVDTAYVEYVAGCVTFHAQHRHWHFDDFALFQLLNSGDVEVANSLKMTFCVADVNRRASLMSQEDAAFSPTSEYYNQCSRKAVQGLSVGWGDNYPNGTSGQYIDITNVADGMYCFVSTADPLNKLKETNESDNVNSRWITLSTAVDGTRAVAVGLVGCPP